MKKLEWSKKFTLIAMIMGFIILQECFFLMLLCIIKGFTATAAWLTAAVAVAEALLITVPLSYHNVSVKNNSQGGLTFEAAKANNFEMDNVTGDSQI